MKISRITEAGYGEGNAQGRVLGVRSQELGVSWTRGGAEKARRGAYEN